MLKRVYHTCMVDMMLNAEDLINLNQAAEILGVVRQTVYNMIDRGELHVIKIADREFVSRTEVEDVKATQEESK